MCREPFNASGLQGSHTENLLTPTEAVGLPIPTPSFPEIPVEPSTPTPGWPALLPPDSLPNLQEPVWLKSSPMGMFQPAVLPTAVWQDFLPFREFQVKPAFDFLTTATARYPWTTEEQVFISRGLADGRWCSCLHLRPKLVKKHHQQCFLPLPRRYRIVRWTTKAYTAVLWAMKRDSKKS